MKPTIEDITRMFNEFNSQIFDNQLKPLPIRIGNTKSSLGSIHFKRRKKLFGKEELYDFSLHISVRFDLQESEIEDVIIHEMIHYYILSRQIRDTSPHGKIFKQMMNAINAKYNRHITISKRTTRENAPADMRIKIHYICVATLNDGRTGLLVSARTRVFEMWRNIPQQFPVSNVTWYVSKEPYFNQFPNALKPRLFIVDKATLTEHLQSAAELINDGHRIMPKAKNTKT